jgi:hypothetical protein
MSAITGTVTDPEFRRRRASHAAKASHSIDSYIQRLVDRAPELTDEQKSRLAAILCPSRTPDDGEAA